MFYKTGFILSQITSDDITLRSHAGLSSNNPFWKHCQRCFCSENPNSVSPTTKISHMMLMRKGKRFLFLLPFTLCQPSAKDKVFRNTKGDEEGLGIAKDMSLTMASSSTCDRQELVNCAAVIILELSLTCCLLF